ncbi:MAG: TadE/TadG family type IV pilus assembly protein [Bryobacteraceae bacterium]
MLESVFIFVPFMALMFAIIDFSMVFFIQNTFKHAVREGVRFAITNRTIAGCGGVTACTKQIVQQNAMGFLPGATGLAKIDVKFYQPGEDADGNLTLTEVTGAGANSSKNVVEVTISNFQWSWMAPLQAGFAMTGRATNVLSISARSSDRMEPPEDDIYPAP